MTSPISNPSPEFSHNSNPQAPSALNHPSGDGLPFNSPIAATVQSCRLRAEACLAMADFIAARCRAFPLVFAHPPYEGYRTGVLTPHIHVYSQRLAFREFGALGWIPSELKGCCEKNVDGFRISYELGHDTTP